MERKNERTTSKEELEAMKAWLDSHPLPDALQLDEATYIPDLKTTVGRLMTQAYLCHENPSMQGSILLLRRIVALLQTGA
ncbi:MAG: hypothetical protein PUD47_08755 [Bacteroidales bacterium]|nr:hypothetical protein [Bacteroidales bacterium]